MLPILAHVTYVTPDVGGGEGIGDLVAALFARPLEVALLVAVAVAVVVALLLDLRFRPLSSFRRSVVQRAESYLGLSPWMLRLSLGLPLIGAGVLRYALAPDVQPDAFPYLLLTLLGFMLLIGFAARAAALLVLVISMVLMVQHAHLVEVIEIPAVALAILVTGSGIPGVDDLLASAVVPTRIGDAVRRVLGSGPQVEPDVAQEARAQEPRRRFVALPVPDLRGHGDVLALVVRLGLGLSLLAAGLTEKLLDPTRAGLAVDKYHLTAVIPVSSALWIAGAGLTEAALGVALLVGAWTRLTAILAFAVLSLTLFALPDDPVLAHVTLFGACSVLVVTGSGRFALDPLRSRWRRRTSRVRQGVP